MRYIIRSGPQVYQDDTPQDALALGEQMAAEGMEDVWIIDEGPDGRVTLSLETFTIRAQRRRPAKPVRTR